MRFLIGFLTLSLFFSLTLLAQTHTSYFPAHTGDSWEYDYNCGFCTATYIVIFDTVSTDSNGRTFIEQRSYYIDDQGIQDDSSITTLIEIDGSSIYTTNVRDGMRHEYQLGLQPGDFWIVDSSQGDYLIGKFYREYVDKIFDDSLTHQIYRYYSTWDLQDTLTWHLEYTKFLVKGLGLARHFTPWFQPHNTWIMKGAKIAGTYYGYPNVLLGTEHGNPMPLDDHTLLQNYPNPFNGETLISYSVSDAGFYRLEIIDILGRHVVTLMNEQLSPGSYSESWDGRNSDGSEASSGTYFYRLSTANHALIKQLQFIR